MNNSQRKTTLEFTSRLHLNSIGHKIMGDPIHGIEEILADNFLKNKLNKEGRYKNSGEH
jgi:23S rRNA pseudouridine1911/1915/1917 synthase